VPKTEPKRAYQHAGVTIYHGDCREVLPRLPAGSIDACVCDPPYGLKFMGKQWDHGVPSMETWVEVLRVLKPGAFLLAFGGTRTHHRLACAIEDAGFEIRDCLMWVYGSGFPKSLDIGKALDKRAGAEREIVGTRLGRPGASKSGMNLAQGFSRKYENREDRPSPAVDLTAPATDAAKLWDGYGTALKPAWEPIIVAMKPLDGTFAENALRHGVAGLNIDAARVPTAEDLGGGQSTVGRREAFDGWKRPWMKDEKAVEASIGRAKQAVAHAEQLGRWPANVLLDEEAAVALDAQSGKLKSGNKLPHHVRHNEGGHSIGSGIGGGVLRKIGRVQCFQGDSGGASRFFYTAKASSAERGTGNDHPTVKPYDLMAYLCKLIAPPTGDVFLDPFCGSGTTLWACKEIGVQAIGIEIEERYCEIAAQRLSQEVLTFA